MGPKLTTLWGLTWVRSRLFSFGTENRETENDVRALCDLYAGFYMVVDTRASVLPSGSTAVLSSPVRRGAARTECLHFWYHMGGENPGEAASQRKHEHDKRKKVKLTECVLQALLQCL